MENREFNKLDELLRQKSYQELTSDELQFVEEQIGGEQAYNELKFLVVKAQQTGSKPISPRIKSDLLHRIKAKNQRSSFFWLSYKTPVYANVLLVVVAILFVWYLKPAKEVIVEKAVTVQLPPIIDTLLIQLPPDTIFIEKQIRVEVPVYITATEEAPAEDSIIKGISLGDQQALKELLVSVR